MMRALHVALWALVPSLGLAGCGSFAFYEETKIGIGISVDPKAPDPVEIHAAFKETVAAFVPVAKGESAGKPTVTVGEMLSDLDVRYGTTAGKFLERREDFLYTTITHGLATGRAARTLASRSTVTPDQARRVVIVEYLRRLSDDDFRTAARRLNLTGVGTAEIGALRSRTIVAVTDSMDPAAVEAALVNTSDGKTLPPFTPWRPAP